MTILLMSPPWMQFAEKLRQNGYALLAAANPKLVVTEKAPAIRISSPAALLCQAVLSAMFAANDIWTAGEAVRLTLLGEKYSALAGLDIPREAA